ncbi:hypothetical protein ACJ73_09610 [Blastomyces percursus]|uniref:Uncharacterized protein n=1 Tax=Blastomyces percursus TaxID=1658174 RepID=A0A1J9Q7H6_9EURO|nr:hypothetical protein ACJ73_09610 [Blastomyces percursus]
MSRIGDSTFISVKQCRYRPRTWLGSRECDDDAHRETGVARPTESLNSGLFS